MSKDEALKLALELLAVVTFYSPELQAKRTEVIEQGLKALAQPEQEPVGEAYLCNRCHTPFDGAYECPSCGHNEATKEPVYTAPPQSKPLTDEQVLDGFCKAPHTNQFVQAFNAGVRFAEAAHGIKE